MRKKSSKEVLSICFQKSAQPFPIFLRYISVRKLACLFCCLELLKILMELISIILPPLFHHIIHTSTQRTLPCLLSVYRA
ncbi:hypothetical protein CISIN_1g034911mg [Citrus sinensis]|uniref:Uncharacterized protein n=1 Tax=Citrus sinensis TaxID=2711 RepID=A0A067DRU2_CITSI|nr:hypothetical protein CISIN_1g034911mg [Citrus sinensis]